MEDLRCSPVIQIGYTTTTSEIFLSVKQIIVKAIKTHGLISIIPALLSNTSLNTCIYIFNMLLFVITKTIIILQNTQGNKVAFQIFSPLNTFRIAHKSF